MAGVEEDEHYDPLMPPAVGVDKMDEMMAAMRIPQDDDTMSQNSESNRAPPATVPDPREFLASVTKTPNGFSSNLSSQGLRPIDAGEHEEPPPPPDMAAGDAPLTEQEKSNLYVSNISLDVTDSGLKELFAPFGNILNSRIMVDIHTCRSRGFGFVQFSRPSEAAKAVKAMDGSVHAGHTLMVRLASRKTRQPGQLTAKMFLRNVPAGVSEDELRRLCSRFGIITTCAVRTDVQHGVVTDGTTGGVSQVAYVTYSDIDMAKQAAHALNNSKPWPACIHPVLAKVLDSNQKRRGGEDGTTPLSTPMGLKASPSPGLMSSDSTLRSQFAAPQAQQTPGSLRNAGLPFMTPSPNAFVYAGGPANLPVPTMGSGVYAGPPAATSPFAYASSSPNPFGAPVPTAMHHGMAVPAGFQVVMQPTLQPVYAGMGYPHPQHQFNPSPQQLHQLPHHQQQQHLHLSPNLPAHPQHHHLHHFHHQQQQHQQQQQQQQQQLHAGHYTSSATSTPGNVLFASPNAWVQSPGISPGLAPLNGQK